MSESTKKSYSKVKGWLPWAVVLAFTALIIFVLEYLDPNFLRFYGPVFPWESAQMIETLRAIHEFQSGSVDLASYWYSRSGALVGRTGIIISLVCLFVLGPSLWVYSELKHEKTQNEKQDPLSRGVLWYISGIFMVSVLVYAIVNPVQKSIIFRNTWTGADKNRNMDQLRSQLYKLAFDAAEIYYLDYKEKGWDGFRSIEGKDGTANSITLNDLPNYSKSNQNMYMLAPVESDSVITIYGIGHFKGNDTDFQNANGETGRIQLAVKVNPRHNMLEFIESEKNFPGN